MKKKRVMLMVAAMSLSLVACGEIAEQPKSDAGVQVVEQQDSEDSVQVEVIQDAEDGANVANPWTTSDKQGVIDATGFAMQAPEGATDVKYSYMSDEKMAQMTYVYEGADWVYRIQPTGSLTDISGMNYEWFTDMSGTVSGMDAEFKGYSEQNGDSGFIDDMYFVQVVNWYDSAAGATYSLSASGMNLDGMDIGVYAENIYNNQ